MSGTLVAAKNSRNETLGRKHAIALPGSRGLKERMISSFLSTIQNRYYRHRLLSIVGEATLLCTTSRATRTVGHGCNASECSIYRGRRCRCYLL
ncbi:hypothetical protein OK016_13110 [Vibrio chagasii]|nr:hypothetical protein [Vibrio chagasii]